MDHNTKKKLKKSKRGLIVKTQPHSDLRRDPRRAQDLPRERHPRRRHLHRTRQAQDRHQLGRRLCPQATGSHPLRLRRLRKTTRKALLRWLGGGDYGCSIGSICDRQKCGGKELPRVGIGDIRGGVHCWHEVFFNQFCYINPPFPPFLKICWRSPINRLELIPVGKNPCSIDRSVMFPLPPGASEASYVIYIHPTTTLPSPQR